MIRATITLIFLFLLIRWLQFEFKIKVSLQRYWRWVAAALLMQLVTVFTSSLAGNKLGNILLHAMGGGVVSTLLFIYLLKTYRIQHGWRVEAVLLFGFVSTLGALNELAEFIMELLHFGIYSLDSHDTWRDITANTLGAFIAWGVIKLYSKCFKPQRNHAKRK